MSKPIKMMMISLNRILTLLLILWCTSGINSQTESEASRYVETTTAIYNTPLCRIVRNLKRNLLEDYSARFQNDLQCGIDMTSSCQAVSCFPDIYQKSLSGGFRLNLCDKNPSVDFWVDSRNSSNKWSRTFTVLRTVQRAEVDIPKFIGKKEGSRNSSKWYLNVKLNLDHSRVRTRTRNLFTYVTLNASFEAWTRGAVPLKIVLVNDTRFQLSQVCDLATGEQSEMFADSAYPEFRVHGVRALDLSSSGVGASVSSQIGQRCDLKSIFQCGIGATCNVIHGNVAVCECLPGYSSAPNGTCVQGDPPDPTVQPIPSYNNSTYSSALGAILSILTLVAVAAGIFFASRNGFGTRLRNRLPLQFSFWPFRRGTAHQVDDQVDMVDPFAQEDDDPPLI